MFNKSSIQHNALLLLLLSSLSLIASLEEPSEYIKKVLERCAAGHQIHEKPFNGAHLKNLCEQCLHKRGYPRSETDNTFLATSLTFLFEKHLRTLIAELRNDYDILRQLDEKLFEQRVYVTKDALLTLINITIDDLTALEEHIDEEADKTYWGAPLCRHHPELKNVMSDYARSTFAALPWWQRIWIKAQFTKSKI